MSDTRPIIIIKKTGGHAGHHGGAWKVAYADFVTALMALFIVLWLMSTSKQVQEAVGGYFRDPSGTGKLSGTSLKGSGASLTVTKNEMSQLKEELQTVIQHMQNSDKLKKQIEMTVTSEGLRIELLETAEGTFFDSGSPEPNQSGKEALAALAKQLGGVAYKISIEGHTDSLPLARNGGQYGNWELSVDRANNARRLMQENGLRADQVAQVRGYADQQLRKPDAPLDPSNRRISLIVEYASEEGSKNADKVADSDKAPGTEPPMKQPGGTAASGAAPANAVPAPASGRAP